MINNLVVLISVVWVQVNRLLNVSGLNFTTMLWVDHSSSFVNITNWDIDNMTFMVMHEFVKLFGSDISSHMRATEGWGLIVLVSRAFNNMMIVTSVICMVIL